MLDPAVVWRRLAAGESLAGLSLSQVDARWNLRSIGTPRSPWAAHEPLPTFRRARFSSLDLSGAELHHFRFFDCEFVDCILDGAHLIDWRQWSTSVRQCSIRNAALTGSLGGARRPPSSWREVDFSGADLRDAGHHTETYTGCDFSSARLTRVSFDGSRHVGSVFAGALDEVAFWSHPQGAGERCSAGCDTGGRIRWTASTSAPLPCASTASTSWTSRRASYRRRPTISGFDDRGVFAARVLDASRDSGTEHVALRVLMEREMSDAPPGGGGPGFRHRLDVGDIPEEIEAAVALMRACGAH